jgi:two-component system, OmpR family, phosphate regulon sensor histidine kinase PhoR
VSLSAPAKSSDKKVAFLQTLWLTRWIMGFIILAAFPINHPRSQWVYGLVLLVVLYSLVHTIPRLAHWRFFSSPLPAVVIDNLFVAGFMYLSGGLSSPFGMFLVLTILACVYWYGVKGAMAVIAAQSIFSAIIVINPSYHPLLLDPLRAMISLVAGFGALAILTERLTRAERTERKTLVALEAESRFERERLMVLINSLPEATFIIDAKGRILLHNLSALNLLGAKATIAGKRLPNLMFLKDRQDKKVNILDKISFTRVVESSDLIMKGSDSADIMLYIRVTPVTGVLVHGQNFILTMRDITKAKSLDQEREEFIAVTSHELKTPLAIAEAALSTALLPQMKATPEISNMIKQAYRNITFLSELVKDLTILAQARNDNIPIKLQPVKPKVLIDQLANDYSSEASNKQIQIVTSTAKDVPEVFTTEHYVRQILQNYLINALKYTPKGKITLNCAVDKDGQVVFSVQDTGVGISASDQKHLFTKFWRSEDYRTRETGGTGLGLYLCAELAMRLNAKVWCESILNKGTTFYLKLPTVSHLKRDRGEVVRAQMSTLVEEL